MLQSGPNLSFDCFSSSENLEVNQLFVGKEKLNVSNNYEYNLLGLVLQIKGNIV